MASPPEPLSRTLNPNLSAPCSASGAVDDGRVPPEFSTFGLSADWRPAFDWAIKNAVLAPLFSIVDAAFIRSSPNRLGTILREIGTPIACECLEDWQGTEPAAAILRRLSGAIVRRSEIYSDFPELPKEKSARSQLIGNLPRDYLFALILEQLPPGSSSERDWFATLRLWILTHAIKRALSGNVQDKNLRIVSAAVRQACDRNEKWRGLINMLATPTIGFEELNGFLEFRATRLTIDSDVNLSSTQKRFLKALIRIARYEHDPDKSFNQDQLHQPLSSQVPWGETLPAREGFSCSIDPPEEGDEKFTTWQDPFKEQTGELVEVPVDAVRSYFHQQLQADSVLLLNAEELQYLPWSWSKPNPYEIQALDRWVTELLADAEPSHRLLGSLVWIAVHTGRSFRRALDIRIAEDPDDEWTLDRTMHTIRRRPPMRRSGWAAKTLEEAQWVRHVAERINIHLPEAIVRQLQVQVAVARDASCLGNLWSNNAQPDALFRSLLPNNLSRITPGIIGNALPQRLFIETNDAAFARLVASHPRSGMPGSCAYANWSAPEVEASLTPADSRNLRSAPAGEPPIGGGSRLDPIESLLKESIRKAVERVRALQASGELIPFHNAYTAYVTVVLLAATGGRPVRDPFESAAHFDSVLHFCFINDKASGETREGRLVPLPKRVSDWIRTDYRRYLTLLIQSLEGDHPDLASGIGEALTGKPNSKMPFLFFLASEPGLTWTSVSEQEINAIGLFDWPLPLNLFRQRLSKQLRRRNVDPEIIDAILGHAENSGASHGDTSMRVWVEDMQELRPALEDSFRALGFPLIASQPCAAGRPLGTSTWKTENKPYGIRARAHNREVRTEHAEQYARFLIAEYLGERQLTSLSSDEVYELSKRLLFTETGMPRSAGYQHYQVLTDELDRSWSELGERVRIARRFAWAQPAPSPFTDQAPGAMDILQRLEEDLNVFMSTVQASRLSLRDCSGLALALLCSDSGLADTALLRDVMEGRNFRTVMLNDKFALEYAPTLDAADPDALVRRYPISPRSASILDRLLGSKIRLKIWRQPVRGTLLSLLEKHSAADHSSMFGDTYEILADKLTLLVDQANVMNLPGVVAGYLSGRVQSYALGWRDWVRLELGYQVCLTTEQKDEPATSVGASHSTTRWGAAKGQLEKKESEARQQAARQFYEDLRETLNKHLRTLPHEVSPAKRRDIANELAKRLNDWSGRVSTSVFLLGQWLPTLVFRTGTKRKFLALSSVARYLAALSPAFQAAAYDKDLMSMDEEDVTLLYEEILEVRSLKHPSYVAERLAEFHRWARRQGVEDPDWADLPSAMRGRQAAPGIVTEQEYQDALRLLLHDTNVDHLTRLAQSFLLLCCYRFGLRGSESLGLLRSDWLDRGDEEIVILLRDNKVRTLKTRASRRQVPLLFRLSPLERDVVRQWLLSAESLHGSADAVAVFATTPGSREPIAVSSLKRRVIEILKLVTGNPNIVLHHARHTAANRVAVALSSLRSRTWGPTSALDGNSCSPEYVQETLLGSSGATRRKTWALARYLGHAGTGTASKTYLHFLPDWVRELLGPKLEKPAAGRFSHVVNLGEFPRQARVNTQLLDTPPQPQDDVTTERVLQFMRLIARGKSHTEAASALSIPLRQARSLLNAIIRIGAGMTLSPLARALPCVEGSDPIEFLRRVTETGWTRLLELAHGAEPRQSEPSTTADLPPKISLSLDQVERMVGATRQVSMWERDHFVGMQAFLTRMRISPDRYVVVRSNGWNQRLQEYVQQTGFSTVDAKTAGRKKPVQLDAAFDGDNQNRVERRCALLFRENNDFSVRNRIEFSILLLAFVSARGSVRARSPDSQSVPASKGPSGTMSPT